MATLEDATSNDGYLEMCNNSAVMVHPVAYVAAQKEYIHFPAALYLSKCSVRFNSNILLYITVSVKPCGDYERLNYISIYFRHVDFFLFFIFFERLSE